MSRGRKREDTIVQIGESDDRHRSERNILCERHEGNDRLEHRAEKWMPVFGKNDAKTKS